MGRRGSFKAFIPPNPPASFVKPANGHMEWAKPVVVDTTVNVDKAKKVVKWAEDRTAQTDYHFIGVDTTARAVTITLPNKSGITTGKILLIKDEGGAAGSNNITVNTGDNSTIDGSATIILDSDYASISVYYNGTEWSVY